MLIQKEAHYIQVHTKTHCTVHLTKDILIIKSKINIIKVQLRILIKKTPSNVKWLFVPPVPVKNITLLFSGPYSYVTSAPAGLNHVN